MTLPFGWERELRDKIAVRQYENWLMADISRVLDVTLRDLAARLVSGSLSLSDQASLTRTLNRVAPLLAGPFNDLRQKFEREMTQLAGLQGEVMASRLEAAFAGGSLEGGVTFLSATQIASIVAFPVQGIGIGEWWERDGVNAALAVKRTIQQGLIEGLSSGDIARRIVRQQAVKKGESNAYRAARGRALGLVRTVTSSITSHADAALFSSQGSEITQQYVFRATLDQRTSPICIGNDGRVFRYDEAFAPIPPLHMLCRSTIIPLLNTAKMAPKVRQSLIDAGLALGPGQRTMAKYATWFGQQTETMQNSILGVGKAELFRSGKISLADLVNSDGRTLTLAELRKKLM